MQEESQLQTIEKWQQRLPRTESCFNSRYGQLAGECLKCVCIFYIPKWPSSAGFCIYLAFLTDKSTYEETQNSGYTQIVTWYICHSEINSHFQYKYSSRTD